MGPPVGGTVRAVFTGAVSKVIPPSFALAGALVDAPAGVGFVTGAESKIMPWVFVSITVP
jgi:hypothetical protein